MMSMRWVLLPILLILSHVPATSRVDGTTSLESDVVPSFPEDVTISAVLPDQSIQRDSVHLRWKAAFAPSWSLAPADLTSSVDENPIVSVTLDFQQTFVPAGVTIDFQWVRGPSPYIELSKPESFVWLDTRWDWTRATDGVVSVHTYSADAADPARVLASATTTLDTMQAAYGLEAVDPISIWSYANFSDFQGTRQANSREAVSAAAYPVHGVISAILPKSQPGETGRIVPHEISHQVLAQATENPWNAPPLWFDEGLAVYLQSGGTSSYEQILERTIRDGEFYRLESLAYAFPIDPAGASLAYAQSWSVVTWLHEEYGAEGVARLIDTFSSGTSWDAAVVDAFGVNLPNLEAKWLSWLRARSLSPDDRLSVEAPPLDFPQGPDTNLSAMEQESHEWRLIPTDPNEQKSLMLLRSSANSHSTHTTSTPIAPISGSSTLTFADPVSGNSASIAALPPATYRRRTALFSSPMKDASNAEPAVSFAMNS